MSLLPSIYDLTCGALTAYDFSRPLFVQASRPEHFDEVLDVVHSRLALSRSCSTLLTTATYSKRRWDTSRHVVRHDDRLSERTRGMTPLAAWSDFSVVVVTTTASIGDPEGAMRDQGNLACFAHALEPVPTVLVNRHGQMTTAQHLFTIAVRTLDRVTLTGSFQVSKEEAEALYGAALARPAGHVVEVGRFSGGTTMVLAIAGRAGKRPGLTSVDSARLPAAEYFFRVNGLDGDIALLDGDSAVVADQWRERNANPGIGLLFIDAASSPDTVARDLAAWTPHMVTGGTIVLRGLGAPDGAVARAVYYWVANRPSYVNVRQTGSMLFCEHAATAGGTRRETPRRVDRGGATMMADAGERAPITRPLRVLHVISSFDGGGAERVLLTLLCGLPEMTQYLALAGTGTLLPLVPASVPVHPVQTEREFVELVVRMRPDVVHTWFDDSLLMTVVQAAQMGVPLVHRLYNVPSIQATFDAHGPEHRERMARALAAATQVVALSATAADDARTHYGIVRAPVIYNGFPLAGNRGMGASQVSKPAGRCVLLNVARLAAEKGQTVLIDAVGRIARKHPHVELWCAGVGPLETELRRQAAAAGIAERVRFLGFCEDVTVLHEAADVFVFPSLTEGFGNALAEALIAGLPVVATDLPAIRREVLGGEPAAALFPAGDAAALATILDRLVSDAPARAALGARARAAGEQFRVDRMLDDYRAVYARVTEETRAAA